MEILKNKLKELVFDHLDRRIQRGKNAITLREIYKFDKELYKLLFQIEQHAKYDNLMSFEFLNKWDITLNKYPYPEIYNHCSDDQYYAYGFVMYKIDNYLNYSKCIYKQ